MTFQTIHQYYRRFTMNSLQGSKFRFILAALMIAGVAFVGCESDKINNLAGPDVDQSSDASISSVAKKGGNGNGNGNGNNNTGNGNEGNGIGNGGNGNQPSWPLVGTYTYTYNNGQGHYNGGKVTFGNENSSKFEIEVDALTPPPGTPWGDPVTVTVEIDYDATTQELLLTFGPHGAQFSPRAEVKIDYRVLGVDLPVLYYIDDNDNRIEQQPDQLDTNKRWLKIYLDHFSRYALVHG